MKPLIEENTPTSNTIYTPLIALLLLFTFSSICIYIPYYIIYKVPTYRKIIPKIKNADKFFKEKKYFYTMKNYVEIVNEYPNFEYGIKQIALSAFSLIGSDDNQNYFELGIYYLSKLKKLDKYTLADVQKHLPHSYKEKFKNRLF